MVLNLILNKIKYTSHSLEKLIFANQFDLIDSLETL